MIGSGFRNAVAGLAIGLLMISVGASHAAGLDVSVSANQIAEGDSFQLSVSADKSALTQPLDLSPLNKDFDILGTAQSSQVRIVNGTRSDRQQWIVTLAPRSRGELTIPALSAGTATSDPLTVEVLDPARMPNPQPAGGPTINVEIADGAHYVQQEIPVTVRVTTAPGFRGGEIIAPRSDDYVLTRSGEDRTTTATIDGQPVSVVERTYMLRPQVSGTLKVAPFTLRAEMTDTTAGRSPFDDFFDSSPFGGMMGGRFDQIFNPGKQLTLRTPPLTIAVKPSPATATGWFLPAKSVKLESAWEPANPTFRVGEAVIRRVTIQALGASGVQLPDLVLSEVPGVRIYTEDFSFSSTDTPDGTAALREFTYSIVPTKGGEITLPEITVDWFDTTTEEARQATLPAETINVLGGVTEAVPQASTPVSGKSSTTAPVNAANPAPFGERAVIAMILVGGTVLLAAVVILFRIARKRRPAPIRAADHQHRAQRASALRQVETGCASNDPRAVYPHAIAWLTAATEATGDRDEWVWRSFPELHESWNDLEARVFSDRAVGSWDGHAFLKQLKAADKAIEQRTKHRGSSTSLPALYPDAPRILGRHGQLQSASSG